MKAFDVAVRDGVDMLSVSIAADGPSHPEVERRNAIAVGAFHAVAEGITVVCSAGNAGPSPQTVQNTSPWILTVGASSADRSFPTRVALGNNWTTVVLILLLIMLILMQSGKKKKKKDLFIIEVVDTK